VSERSRRKGLGLPRGCGVLVLGLLAAAPASAQVAAPLDAVDVFVRATAAGDAEAIASLYAPNAILLAPGAPVFAGRDTIRSIQQRNAAAGQSSMVFDDVKMDAGENQAVVLWSWTTTIKPASGGDTIVQRGRSMVYFVRAPEGWFISVDMFQAAPPN